MPTTVDSSPPERSTAMILNRIAYYVCRRWMLLFSLFYGLYVGLPFLAPVFMAAGMAPLGKWIYTIYSFLCHQLPERSFFLFGPRLMVPLPQILANWKMTHDPFVLRQFIGNPTLGWKVAWSDRMVSMYTSILLFAWVWWLFRSKVRATSWKVLALFLLPMAVDGGTHFISDLAGMHQGFRDSNAWLAQLTQNTLPPAFYAGDAWGSFNSILRLATGILFGLGIVWFGFPHIQAYFTDQAAWIAYKFHRAGLKL